MHAYEQKKVIQRAPVKYNATTHTSELVKAELDSNNIVMYEVSILKELEAKRLMV